MKYRIKKEDRGLGRNKWSVYTLLEYYNDEKNEPSGQYEYDLESVCKSKEEALKEVFHLAMEMESEVIDVEF